MCVPSSAMIGVEDVEVERVSSEKIFLVFQ
jgi:hypothetical protein